MTVEKWHADIEITKEIVIDCLQNQFPELNPIKSITFIGEGWDNKAFLINNKIIFRFPRRKIAAELIERENQVLKYLQHIPLGLEIPNPRWHGKPTSIYPYAFHGYDMIAGISGCHALLTEQQRIASVPKLAVFLKSVHSIDEAQALSIGALPQVFDKTNLNNTVTMLIERVEKIDTLKIMEINKESFQQEILTAQNIMLSEDKCLVHGDLYCRHVFFNNGALTGIIDWGDTGINNKAVDLAVIWSFYPDSCHQQFFEMYGDVDTATWQMARFFGLYTAITVMLYSHDVGDNLLLAEAIDSVKRINRDLFTQSE